MTTITDVRTVGVPVADQDAALAFFKDTLGFETRLDAPISDTLRWIEIAPPSSSTSIALVIADDGHPSGLDTGVRFSVKDAAAEHADMTSRGVTTSELFVWDEVPPMFTFTDPDSNLYYVVES